MRFPRKTPKMNFDKIAESIAYEEISKDTKDTNLILLYDEANLLLFEGSKAKRRKKI